MKRILIVLLILCAGVTKAQDNSHNLNIITAPGAYNDGFNVGVQWDFQMGIPYIGVELFHFAELNDITYNHVVLRAGVGYEIGNPVGVQWRGNIGFRGGRVFRTGHQGPFALLGLEIGAQMTLPSGLYGKLVYGRDTKTDSAIWHEDDHTVDSVFIGIGVRM